MFEEERETYLREKERLLAEGERGRFAVILGDEIISIWDTFRDASQAGYEKFGLDKHFMIQEILPQERPVIIPILSLPDAYHQRNRRQ